MATTTKGGNPHKKVEVLTANYPIAVTFDKHTKKKLVNEVEADET
jgi:hypothetical protein